MSVAVIRVVGDNFRLFAGDRIPDFRNHTGDAEAERQVFGLVFLVGDKICVTLFQLTMDVTDIVRSGIKVGNERIGCQNLFERFAGDHPTISNVAFAFAFRPQFGGHVLNLSICILEVGERWAAHRFATDHGSASLHQLRHFFQRIRGVARMIRQHEIFIAHAAR